MPPTYLLVFLRVPPQWSGERCFTSKLVSTAAGLDRSGSPYESFHKLTSEFVIRLYIV